MDGTVLAEGVTQSFHHNEPGESYRLVIVYPGNEQGRVTDYDIAIDTMD